MTRPLSAAGKLELGKAAEHLVCADLILGGYRAFLSDQGLPYDVVIDLSGRLIRVQVKGTRAPVNVNAAGRNARLCYSFGVRRRGKGGSKRLSAEHCDIVALVALDIRVVAYLPLAAVGQSVQMPAPVPSHVLPRGRVRTWAKPITSYPFEHALASITLPQLETAA